MRIETNSAQVKKSIASTRTNYQQRTRTLARRLSVACRDNIRANISKPTFPGYAITGALARKVVAGEPAQTSAGWQAVVKIQMTGQQKLYAMIHEVGGWI